MAQILSMVVNERLDDWDAHLSHVQFAYNNSFGAATDLVPNEVRLGRMPRLSLTTSERTNIDGHRRLEHDRLAYCELTSWRVTNNDALSAYCANSMR